MPRRKLDTEFSGAIHIEESLAGNLNLGKSCSQWMKAFAEKLDAMA